MIPINNPALYTESIDVLKDAAGSGFRGRAAQIFLACKHYGNRIPRIGSAVGIESNQLQQLLDDLYHKPSQTGPESVAIIFDADHKVPTGKIAGGLRTPSNIWRNNLNLQKGFICYATVQELQNPTFLAQSRKICPHLRPANTTTLSQSWCDIKARTSGTQSPVYRGEDNPKIFRKDPATNEYTVHDPQDVSFYSGIMRPASGVKLPIAALIIAIYYDSFLAAGRSSIDVGDFLTDFGFNFTEASAYFDDDPTSDFHQRLAVVFPGINWTLFSTTTTTVAPQISLPGLPLLLVPKASNGNKASSVVNAASIGVTTSPPPPAISGWWDAQQAVRKTLEAAGWTVTDTSGLKVGYDFKIIKAGKLKLIEVKSSVGICTASLTKLEYDQAALLRRDFVLAIVENFNPAAQATIQWVEDPARLQMTMRQVIEYTLPRSIWKKHTVPMP